uniref:Putative terminase n=2 Tax=viral metagenome TaxID=1070528 RepID=A0A6M3L0Z4_9ZZZZ
MTESESNRIDYHPETGEPLKVKHRIKYIPVPSILMFFRCTAIIRSIAGPAGSGKTLGGAMEIIYRIPRLYWNRYGITSTRWAVVRNTQPMLRASTQKTFFEEFPIHLFGKYNKNEHVYDVHQEYRDGDKPPVGLDTEIMFMSCDRQEDVDQFKGVELTGYLIDESCEVSAAVKTKLKERIGRYPSFRTWKDSLRNNYPNLKAVLARKNIDIPDLRKMSDTELRQQMKQNRDIFLTAFGIELTNPPHIESDSYYNFDWRTVEGFTKPGPKPEKDPAPHHVGFWQPPFENEANLKPGYYQDMMEMWKHVPDHIERYIMGEPGVDIRGSSVYKNFVRAVHESKTSLTWERSRLFRGWDNTGHSPACVVVQVPVKNPRQIQVLKEFFTEEESMVDFGKRVKATCARDFPNAEYFDWSDPSGHDSVNEQKDGTRKSNAELLYEECGLKLEKSIQSVDARINAVDSQLGERPKGDPGLLIDPGCSGLLNGFLGGYYYPEIRGQPGNYRDSPLKNKWSHRHDALQYVVVKLRHEEIDDDDCGEDNYGRPSDPMCIF